MIKHHFHKMHGLGNDFVIFDARKAPVSLNKTAIQHIANRHQGIGCDQIIVIDQPQNELADAFMHIYNADGGYVEACGNATRCVALLLSEEKKKDHITIQTTADLLDCHVQSPDLIQVDMGRVGWDWREIPLKEACDTNAIPLEQGPFSQGVAVNIGNPHLVFFVDQVAQKELARHGAWFETHPFFPQGTNVEAVWVQAPDHLVLKVWERGAGLTQACGSGACAAAAAAYRRKLSNRKVKVTLPGGDLWIEYLPDNHVLMSGPATKVFEGDIDLS